jgi:hypothetical protein
MFLAIPSATCAKKKKRLSHITLRGWALHHGGNGAFGHDWVHSVVLELGPYWTRIPEC